MRLRKRPWVKDEIMEYTDYMVQKPEEVRGKWKQLFKNEYPIHIELGTGRGQFITALAVQNPSINFVALEQKQEVLVQAVRKANEMKLPNIKFILGNANNLMLFFAENELNRIYLNFSDPWPKNRHAKRRLTHQRYLDIYKQILDDEGEIMFKTDNALLFEFSLNELIKQDFHLNHISLDLYRDEENIRKHTQTEYEDKFMKQGKPIFRLEAKR